MRYFIIETIGDVQDRKLAFIDNPPEGLGLYYYCMARGERIGARFPTDAKVFLESRSPGIKLPSLIGNALGYLIVNTEMKSVINECCKLEVETLPFTLYNHKKRIHSKDYWIVNPIGSIDCLNKAASEIIYATSSREAVVAVHKFVVDPSKISGEPNLFRVPEDREKYFIGESLAKTFQQHNFTNVFLLEVDVKEAALSDRTLGHL